MFNHPYICLCSLDELSDDEMKLWFNSVDTAGPNGVIVGTELRPDNKPIRFYYRKEGNKNRYIVSLSRDLTKEEAAKIVQHYSSNQPNGDFEIHWSQKLTQDNINRRQAQVKEDLIKSIALEASKRNHGNWYRNKIDEGWRYGAKFSTSSKTSPLLKDWEQLSEKYKILEYKRMISLLDVLNEMNLKLTYKRV